MTVKIIAEGYELNVPTSELALVLRQLHEFSSTLKESVPERRDPSPLASAPPPWHPSAQAELRTPSAAQLQLADAPSVNASSTISFLQAIADGTPAGGLTSDEMALVLGVQHPKGIGSKAIKLNEAIKSCGFTLSDVYSNRRDATGARRWTAEPKLSAAIQALRQGENRA